MTVLGRFSTSQSSTHALTGEEIATIREASLHVLERVGVQLDHDIALQTLASSGAIVTAGRVFIPPGLVEEALSRAPREVRLAGLAESDDLTLSSTGDTYCRAAIGIDYCLDHRSGERRKVTSDDLRDWVRISDSLPNIHLVSPLYPQDLQPVVRDLAAVQSALLYSRKPIIICALSVASLKQMITMLSVTPRGITPRLAVVFSCDSPLTLAEKQIDQMLVAAAHKLPILLNSSGLAGATCPVTPLGTLVQLNAEVLAALTLVQHTHPGSSVIYDIHPLIFDMRSGAAAFGRPELGMLNSAFVELGKSYDLPTESSGFKTDSHSCDEQAGLEKALTGFMSILSGPSLVSGAGSLSAAATSSLIQLVIDEDLIGTLLPLRCTMQEDSIEDVLRVIARVGPRGNFLADEHTAAKYRRSQPPSVILPRGSWETWKRRGGRTAAQIAHDRLEGLLAAPSHEMIGTDAAATLATIVEKATGKDP